MLKIENKLLLDGTNNRRQAINAINMLGSEENCCQDRLIYGIGDMIGSLPPKKLLYRVGEMELCSRYASPIIKSMFEDTGSTRFTWSNLKVASVAGSVTDKRPDGVIHVESNDQLINVVGYCEAKAEKSNKHHMVFERMVDMMRLAVFSKKGIDARNTKVIFSIQITGFSMHIYAMELLYNGMYVFIHIAKINIPASLEDVPRYLDDLDEISSTSEYFYTSLGKQLSRSTRDYKKEEHTKVTLGDLLSTKRNARRKCSITF